MGAFLLLRLEAPLMAFGGPMVDHIGRTRDVPGQAQLTGLLGNALGWRHGDEAALGALQRRLRFAAADARAGERLRDYHTVDLGRPHLTGRGWTTRGRVEGRDGASSDTTHIRHRWYLADALVLVALTLEPAEPAPTLSDLATALERPARPLFIGRKPCLPTAPLLLGVTDAGHVTAALCHGLAKLGCAAGVRIELDARLAVGVAFPGPTEAERLVDRRDWRNQLHDGERAVVRTRLPPAGLGA